MLKRKDVLTSAIDSNVEDLGGKLNTYYTNSIFSDILINFRSGQ
jgi:hypothetical protein